MKVLLVNTYDLKGGAARAVGRLFSALKELGAGVSLMVQNKDSEDPGIIETGTSLTRKFNFIRPYVDFAISYPMVRKRILFSTSLLPDRFAANMAAAGPDIVHLNWIAGGMLRIESLAAIRQPVVWTLHDLWAFTGGCHYPVECKRYLDQCGRCPILHSGRENDMSRKVFERKRETYPKIKNLHIVAPSRWLAACAGSSSLFGKFNVTVIPNGLDTQLFKPSGKDSARQKFGLPSGKKIILFGGIRAVEYPLKGFQLLLESLLKTKRDDLELVVFGSVKPGNFGHFPFKVHFLGHVAEERDLACLYSAADMVAVPSLQEVFGQTASESLSCGVPVVAFATGGLTDIIDHKENGYLARSFDTGDLASGIVWVLEDSVRYAALSASARLKAVNRFDIRTVARQYLDLYGSLVMQSPEVT